MFNQNIISNKFDLNLSTTLSSYIDERTLPLLPTLRICNLESSHDKLVLSLGIQTAVGFLLLLGIDLNLIEPQLANIMADPLELGAVGLGHRIWLGR